MECASCPSSSSMNSSSWMIRTRASLLQSRFPLNFRRRRNVCSRNAGRVAEMKRKKIRNVDPTDLFLVLSRQIHLSENVRKKSSVVRCTQTQVRTQYPGQQVQVPFVGITLSTFFFASSEAADLCENTAGPSLRALAAVGISAQLLSFSAIWMTSGLNSTSS